MFRVWLGLGTVLADKKSFDSLSHCLENAPPSHTWFYHRTAFGRRRAAGPSNNALRWEVHRRTCCFTEWRPGYAPSQCGSRWRAAIGGLIVRHESASYGRAQNHPDWLVDLLIAAIAGGLLLAASKLGLEAGRSGPRGVGSVFGDIYMVRPGASRTVFRASMERLKGLAF